MAVPLTDRDPMPFGKHRGVPMEEVPASYLDWLDGQPWIDQWPQVKGYITNNKSVINQELTEGFEEDHVPIDSEDV